MTDKSEEKLLVNARFLSEELGVAEGTIYQWVMQRRIPHIKLGKSVRFDMSEIRGWVQSKSKKVEAA